MTKQTETIRQLTDRVNALEAICQDLLTAHFNSPAQARVKFDDYRIKFTQEAVEKREAEAKAKQLRENLAAAKSEFRDRANADYWSLVFMNQKQREKALDDIWQSTITDIELPEGATRPAYEVTEPSEDKLLHRRSELIESIDRASVVQCHDTIKHCEKSQADFTKDMEQTRDRLIAALRRKDKITEAERAHQISETQADYDTRIRQHLQTQKRQIDSAKVQLARRERDEAELKQVEALLAELMKR